MGMFIALTGNTPVVLGALTSSSRVRPVTLFEPGERPRPRLPKEQPGEDFPRISRDNDAPQIGIGQGAASTPALAMKTVTRTVEEANRNRPSVEELTVRSQERAARVRALLQHQLASRAEATRATPTPQRDEVAPAFASTGPNKVESRLPAPSVEARNFVSTVNETAADRVVRVGEVEPPEPSSAPSLQIDSQSTPNGSESTDRTRLNITA